MASIGCEVTALERSLVVAALLENAVQRIAQRQPDVAARLRLQCMDALDYLAVLASEQRDPPDVIYIDPMFPPRRSKTVERKPMRVLRSLVGEDADATALLDRARQVARKRVVVKRPLRAEALDDVAPDLTFKGNAVRYDLYLNTS